MVLDPKNIPKLGGFGKVVEIESYVWAQQRTTGRRHDTTWMEVDKWVCGLEERDSLDCVLNKYPQLEQEKCCSRS